MIEIFRGSDGSVISPSSALRLPLDCFATSEIAQFGGEVANITISHATLALFLSRAETLKRLRHPLPGKEHVGKKSKRKTRKRRRPSTPADEIKSVKEARFVGEESRMSKVECRGQRL